jgi:hypothetical protein
VQPAPQQQTEVSPLEQLTQVVLQVQLPHFSSLTVPTGGLTAMSAAAVSVETAIRLRIDFRRAIVSPPF